MYYYLASSLLLSLLCALCKNNRPTVAYVFSISVNVLAIKYAQMMHRNQFYRHNITLYL